MSTIALLGVGKLGEALLSWLLRSGTPPGRMLAAERHADHAAEIAQRYGVTTLSPEEATARADVVLLAVKPQDMRALLNEVAGHLRPGTLVVSMAAGITAALVEELLPDGTSVVRVMTNTPVFVDEAMSAISAARSACRSAASMLAAGVPDRSRPDSSASPSLPTPSSAMVRVTTGSPARAGRTPGWPVVPRVAA